MKILLASTSSGSRGGGELYLLYLARALARRGHEVALWCAAHPRMDELAALFAPIGLVHRSEYRNTYDYRLRSVSSYLNFSAAKRIAREWREIAPDLLHVNKQNLEDGLDLLRAATRTRLPSVATIHLTQTARYLRAVMAGLRDFVARRALKAWRWPMVCVLPERERDLRDFTGARDGISAIPNGVELYDLAQRPSARTAKRAELGISGSEILFSAVGRLVPQKRPMVFLELAARIHARLPQARFVWVGDGKLAPEWDAWVASRGLGAVIRRTGWQKHVRDFLFATDVFLHTAEFEGLPLAILEALSAGLPCAITPNLLAEMPFLNHSNSIAIGESDEWAAVLGDPARLAALGTKARQLAEEQFSFAIMAARYEALYQSVLAPRR
jgi:glycosyltransferase involved in cell wall biosynthesis